MPLDKITLLTCAVTLGSVLLAGPAFIDLLKSKMMGQTVREDGPQSHQSKTGTPTLGGFLIALSVIIGLLFYGWKTGGAKLTINFYIVLGVGLVLGALGFLDDYLKITKRHNKGVSGYTKLAVQFGLSLAIGLYIMVYQNRSDINLFNTGAFHLGILYPILSMFVITGASNAVNLTDGLDGLVSINLIISLLASALILSLNNVPDLALLSLVLASGCAGFLWFNKHPAKIFMGDTGSLALGGMLGAIMVLGKVELWLLFTGVVFIMEALSVIIQVASFKSTGKRVFKMAPLHHHFELSGLHETKVVWLFATAQLLSCLIAVWLLFR